MDAVPTSSTNELVFVPAPGAGHIVSTVQLANLLVSRDPLLSVTILVMNLPNAPAAVDTYVEAAASATPKSIRFVHLPRVDPTSHLALAGTKLFFPLFAETQKDNVKEALIQLFVQRPPPHPRLAGLVIDMFCTTMIDVAHELGVPTYMFFTSGAATLGVICHLQSLHDHSHVTVNELDGDAEIEIPTFKNPMQVKLFPSLLMDKNGGFEVAMTLGRRFRETQGIIVNTFSELETYAINSLDLDTTIPKIYPIGPILDMKKTKEEESTVDIMAWLDKQPDSSVVFLCFGSMGAFGDEQLREIARGLEQSGHRFLWSMRRTPPKGTGKFELPKNYENPKDVLPEEFLNRTAEIGKIIGWAPQTAILAHPAVGGFVSHCGWNSVLESLWFGVPVAAWPMYAEQQCNAFQLVKDLEIAAEVKIAYKTDMRSENVVIVRAEEIERGVRQVMEQESEVRKKVKDLKAASQKAVQEGGSSHAWLGRFIEDVTIQKHA